MAGREVDRDGGVSPAGERRWGQIGGLVGAVYGVGAAVIAVFVEGRRGGRPAGIRRSFATPRLLVFDAYQITALVVGVGFLVAALALARLSRYPRTDAGGR
jgi:hypothetical protein